MLDPTRICNFLTMSVDDRKQLISELVEAFGDAIMEGQTTTAFEIARLGVLLRPADPWWLYKYANGLREIGRRSEAEPLLLDVHPRKTRNRYLVEVSLGQLYRDSGRFDEAERWFTRATETAPTDTAPWVYLGGFLARMERFAEACVVLERGLDAQGDVDEVWFNIGLNKRGLGDYQAAKRSMEKAIEITPDYTEAIAALGDIDHAIAVRSMNERAVETWRTTEANPNAQTGDSGK